VWVVFVMLFVGVTFAVYNKECESIQQKVEAEEKREKALMEEYNREIAAWKSMTTPEALRTALSMHGIAGGKPSHSQIIAMYDSGAEPGYATGAGGGSYASR